jgi:raffinose/stachyose/melibiose transport system substrate-binding protein
LSPANPPGRPLSRRSLFAGGAVAAATVALAGCGGGTASVNVYQPKREAYDFFRDVIADVNKDQSAYAYVQDISANLSAGFARHDPPDLGIFQYDNQCNRFVERGGFSDLSDLPEADTIRSDIQDLADWYPSYEGRTSILPYSVCGAAVIYNKKIFAENDLDVPETWDALIEVCEKLQEKDIVPIYGTYREPWTISQGLLDYCVGGMIDVREFFDRMNELGDSVGPDSEVSFQRTWLEPVKRMLTLAGYSNPDASSRGYGDGNTAIATGKAAMYLQGPWALAEIDKSEKEVDLGQFPLPVTDDPADRKIRLNLDLALWVPVESSEPEGARKMLQHLMEPEIQNPYNEKLLGFGTTEDAPDAKDPRLADLQKFYDDGAFYAPPVTLLPRTMPYDNYFQSIVLGTDPTSVLAQMDEDWARLAYRQ